jgi:hypothetical protein
VAGRLGGRCYISFHPTASRKRKGTTLPPRRSYDPRSKSSRALLPIYPLSEVEQLVLREFLDESLANRFIRTSSSTTFIRKKDGSPCLMVDYWGLNHITKKDRSPLPLITNLLDCLQSVHVCSKSTFGAHGQSKHAPQICQSVREYPTSFDNRSRDELRVVPALY